MQLVVDKIAKAFGIHEIFKDVSFMVEQGEHIGALSVSTAAARRRCCDACCSLNGLTAVR